MLLHLAYYVRVLWGQKFLWNDAMRICHKRRGRLFEPYNNCHCGTTLAVLCTIGAKNNTKNHEKTKTIVQLELSQLDNG